MKRLTTVLKKKKKQKILFCQILPLKTNTFPGSTAQHSNYSLEKKNSIGVINQVMQERAMYSLTTITIRADTGQRKKSLIFHPNHQILGPAEGENKLVRLRNVLFILVAKQKPESNVA